uniref:Uncharacterized protein n=1 Tax=Bionectria ochroleuca TaxID=29856 RepID=A0A8H7N5C4_BIOOC
MGSFRDPILISQLDWFLQSVKGFAGSQHSHVKEKWDIGFHTYGFNEHDTEYVPSEVFIVAEVIAESQEVATSLASTVRVHCTHGSYPKQKATSGNFAMGIGGKFELETKECAEFSIYHLMPLSGEEEGARQNSLAQADINGQRGLFRWQEYTLGNGDTYAKVGVRATSSESSFVTQSAGTATLNPQLSPSLRLSRLQTLSVMWPR